VNSNPANRHRAVAFTYDQWRYVFTNTFDAADARAAYDRVPASGGIFWDSVLANFIPGPHTITEITEFPRRSLSCPPSGGGRRSPTMHCVGREARYAPAAGRSGILMR
jgi:hypothetical protein